MVKWKPRLPAVMLSLPVCDSERRSTECSASLCYEFVCNKFKSAGNLLFAARRIKGSWRLESFYKAGLKPGRNGLEPSFCYFLIYVLIEWTFHINVKGKPQTNTFCSGAALLSPAHFQQLSFVKQPQMSHCTCPYPCIHSPLLSDYSQLAKRPLANPLLIPAYMYSTGCLVPSTNVLNPFVQCIRKTKVRERCQENGIVALDLRPGLTSMISGGPTCVRERNRRIWKGCLSLNTPQGDSPPLRFPPPTSPATQWPQPPQCLAWALFSTFITNSNINKKALLWCTAPHFLSWGSHWSHHSPFSTLFLLNFFFHSQTALIHASYLIQGF